MIVLRKEGEKYSETYTLIQRKAPRTKLLNVLPWSKPIIKVSVTSWPGTGNGGQHVWEKPTTFYTGWNSACQLADEDYDKLQELSSAIVSPQTVEKSPAESYAGRKWWLKSFLNVSWVTAWEWDKGVLNQKLAMTPQAAGKIGKWEKKHSPLGSLKQRLPF